MNALVVITGVLFAGLSSAMIAYISMATMIGPWIAPTLVLISRALFSFIKSQRSSQQVCADLTFIQTIGSIGGIIGMAVGFSLPTLYFLSPEYFMGWLQTPLHFCAFIAAICLAAGALGMCLGRIFREKLLVKEKLQFPVSQLIYEGIASRSQSAQTKQLFSGMGITALFCFLRDGVLTIPGVLKKTIYMFPSLLGRSVPFALFPGPTLWAMGFITGGTIAIPLFVGMLSKYIILWPLQYHADFLPFSLFPKLDGTSFTMAFCSGMLLSETALGLLRYPKTVWKSIKTYINRDNNHDGEDESQTMATRLRTWAGTVQLPGLHSLKKTGIEHLELLVALSASMFALYNLGFGFLSQIFVLVSTVIATYNIAWLGGKVGILPFGRFATFVMVPTMLIFGLTNHVQITFLCVFVNVCAGVAADLLFDYKVGELGAVSIDKIHRYQWLGLIITSLCIGFFLWLLFTNFSIGSPELFAQRGKTRALLIQSINSLGLHGGMFDLRVLIFGALYGYGVKKCKVSPALAMGGILMPNGISIGLILGGFCSKLFKHPKRLLSFWSGVFACESLWILFGMLLKLVGAQ